jgi:hypothetical protein
MARALAVVKEEDGWETPPPFGKEEGSSFGYLDRMFYGWDQKGGVFDYGDWEARDLVEMMKKDYKARQIEGVLALPILSADREIVGVKGDKGELDWLQAFWEADFMEGGCKTPLDTIIGGMTTGITFKKAFFELVFRPGFENKIAYEKVAFRPQTTCRMIRDGNNGDFLGFEQEAYAAGPGIRENLYPIKIPRKRAFVYVHGQRLDPLNGSSDLEIAHWCYKTKQKILYLWMQFLESVALPRTIVKAQDVEVARQIAGQIARMRGSAILPVGTQGAANTVDITTLDSSGKGSDQFREAITWLDTAATNSIHAGFLDLTGAAANGIRGGGGGSYALSKDASDYFLQFDQAKCREMERMVRRDLFGPLIRYNFGIARRVPKLKFAPLNSEDKSNQVTMLQALMAAKGPDNIPTEFIALLATSVANYFGMDGTKVHDSFIQAGKDAAAKAAAASAAGAAPLGQGVAQMAGATNAAQAMVAPKSMPAKKGNRPLPPELAHIDFQALQGAA